jgi:transketolase
MQFGVPRKLSAGSDFVLLTSGICTEEGMRAVRALRQTSGIRIAHYHISTLKPFDHPELIRKIQRSKYGVITLENHSVIGGLGTIVAEKMAEAGCSRKLYRLGLQDTFVHGASRRYLMKKYGIDAAALLALVSEITGQEIDISEKDLQETYTPQVHSIAKAEAL